MESSLEQELPSPLLLVFLLLSIQSSVSSSALVVCSMKGVALQLILTREVKFQLGCIKHGLQF